MPFAQSRSDLVAPVLFAAIAEATQVGSSGSRRQGGATRGQAADAPAGARDRADASLADCGYPRDAGSHEIAAISRAAGFSSDARPRY
jgi:hypothetical protein